MDRSISIPLSLFYAYAHEDEVRRNELEKHLSLLQRQSVITTKHHRLIVPGTDWAQALDRYLNEADVILLLISSDFLASDYCYGMEMQRALKRHQNHEARVIPILLRPVDWQGAPFHTLQVLPTDGKPVTSWSNLDAAFADIATGIRQVMKELSPDPITGSAPVAPPFWNIPFTCNLFFTGRDNSLTALETSSPDEPSYSSLSTPSHEWTRGSWQDTSGGGICLSVRAGLRGSPLDSLSESRNAPLRVCQHCQSLAITGAL